ncbi:MAG: FtsW/RodA/SpoVE family cell cycle protein [Rubrobacter sp.]|nr:FtsW/RodA/SpoVE family cell cycle protein [Rubrobacter sp.]
MTQRAAFPMMLAFVAVAVGFATLLVTQKVATPPMIYGGVYLGTMCMLYFAVRIRLRHSDALLIPLVTLLTGVGLLMVYRLTYNVDGVQNLAITQVVWILVGSGALFLTILLFRDYQRLLNYRYLLALIAIGLITSTILFGREVNGAKLWLQIGPVSFEPSQFAQILLIMFFAKYLAEKREVMTVTTRSFLGLQIPSLKYFGPVVLVWLISIALLIFEKDIGFSLLFMAVSLLMMYTATGRITYVLLGTLLFLIGLPVLYQVFTHVRVRIDSWLDPWSDPYATGFQILQSIFNISDGGLTGTGLGQGFAQSIPDVQTDYVFSAIASELGFLGATVILLTFLMFAYRGMKIALLAEDPASKLLAGGLTITFTLQTLIVVGGVTKAIPLTGLGLPFVSYGGTAVISNFILTGFLLVISEQAGQKSADIAVVSEVASLQ